MRRQIAGGPYYTGYALNRLARQVASVMEKETEMTLEQAARLIGRPCSVASRVLKIAAGVPAYDLELDKAPSGRVNGIRRRRHGQR